MKIKDIEIKLMDDIIQIFDKNLSSGDLYSKKEVLGWLKKFKETNLK